MKKAHDYRRNRDPLMNAAEILYGRAEMDWRLMIAVAFAVEEFAHRAPAGTVGDTVNAMRDLVRTNLDGADIEGSKVFGRIKLESVIPSGYDLRDLMLNRRAELPHPWTQSIWDEKETRCGVCGCVRTAKVHV